MATGCPEESDSIFERKAELERETTWSYTKSLIYLTLTNFAVPRNIQRITGLGTHTLSLSHGGAKWSDRI